MICLFFCVSTRSYRYDKKALAHQKILIFNDHCTNGMVLFRPFRTSEKLTGTWLESCGTPSTRRPGRWPRPRPPTAIRWWWPPATPWRTRLAARRRRRPYRRRTKRPPATGSADFSAATTAGCVGCSIPSSDPRLRSVYQRTVVRRTIFRL